MSYAREIEPAILRHLDEQGSPTMGELFRSLSHFTLNQVLFVIDRLSQQGKVILRQPTRFAYLVSATASGTRTQVSPQANR
jgi:hypothetical protein